MMMAPYRVHCFWPSKKLGLVGKKNVRKDMVCGVLS